MVLQFLQSHEPRDLKPLQRILDRVNLKREVLEKNLGRLEQERNHLLKREQELSLAARRSSRFNLAFFKALQDDMEPSQSALIFHLIFMARRVVVVGIAFVFKNKPFV